MSHARSVEKGKLSFHPLVPIKTMYGLLFSALLFLLNPTANAQQTNKHSAGHPPSPNTLYN